MFEIEYDDIEVQWHGEPPADPKQIERSIRSHLRHNVLPTKAYDLHGYFIVVAASLIFVFGVAGSDVFYCTYFH